jgi:hypothetical protein
MKSIIATGLAAASLALSASVAMAASPAAYGPIVAARQPAYTSVLGGTWPDVHVAEAPAPRYASPLGTYGTLPRTQAGFDVAQFVGGVLGGTVPYANLVREARQVRGSAGTYESPDLSFSTAADTPVVGNDAQLASDAENQAIQQMNDTNALTASMAAAEEENDEANAATLQTEINAGM